MKVVLDTNVLVSGILNPSGSPGEIVRMASFRELELCYDARVFGEYEDVLRRPGLRLEESAVEALLAVIAANGRVVASLPLPERLPDRDDEPFLEVALAAGASFLVTGNLRHFPASARCGMKVVDPAAFLDALRSGGSGLVAERVRSRRPVRVRA